MFPGLRYFWRRSQTHSHHCSPACDESFFLCQMLKLSLHLEFQHFDYDLLMYGFLCTDPTLKFTVLFEFVVWYFSSILEKFQLLCLQLSLLPHSFFCLLLGFQLRVSDCLMLSCTSWMLYLILVTFLHFVFLFGQFTLTSLQDHLYFPLLFSLLLTYWNT